VAKDVDAVIDGLGGEWQQRSFGVLKPGGILVALNQPPSADEAARHHVRAMMLQTQGSTAQLDALSAQIEAGKLKPFIGRTYTLKDVPQAWTDSRASHIEGKIVFQVG
jgi:NADPH:quinone reductase-like Zn-dependent oxidoreductase